MPKKKTSKSESVKWIESTVDEKILSSEMDRIDKAIKIRQKIVDKIKVENGRIKLELEHVKMEWAKSMTLVSKVDPSVIVCLVKDELGKVDLRAIQNLDNIAPGILAIE